MALRLVGVKPSILNDVTGTSFFEKLLTERLEEIGPAAGPNFVPGVR
jgi:hypothetical protein